MRIRNILCGLLVAGLLLWKSDNEAVATVFCGRVHAKQPGEAVLCAYAQSGSVTKEIRVTVTADASLTPGKFTVQQRPEHLKWEEQLQLEVTFDGAKDDVLYFSSSDEKVATVNPFGRLIAVGDGVCEVTVASCSGAVCSFWLAVGNGKLEPVTGYDEPIEVTVNDRAPEQDKKAGDKQLKLLIACALLLTGLAGIGAHLGARKKAAAGGQEKDRTKKTNKAGGAKK